MVVRKPTYEKWWLDFEGFPIGEKNMSKFPGSDVNIPMAKKMVFDLPITEKTNI